MSTETYDFVIVGGGSAGSALANRLSADPANKVLVLEAGRSDFKWDVFIHMPAALTFPIGSAGSTTGVTAVEPEPHMNRRRIYHARGKVLGGSASINGMIFQRGNPLDYERWADDPGMSDLGLRALPAVLQAHGELPRRPADGQWHGHDGPLELERGPATNPLFERLLRRRRGSGLPAHRRRQRLPAGGLRALRPQRPERTAAVGGARVPAPGAGPARTSRYRPARSCRRSSSTARARSASSTRRAAACRPRCTARRSSSAAGRSTPRSCCSSPASATPPSWRARHRRGDGPARRRREPPGPPGGVRPVLLQAAGLDAAVAGEVEAALHRRAVAVPAVGAGRDATTSRAAGSSAPTTR